MLIQLMQLEFSLPIQSTIMLIIKERDQLLALRYVQVDRERCNR